MTIPKQSPKQFKRGSTFLARVTIPSGTAGLLNLNGVGIASSVLASDKVEYSGTIIIPDPDGLMFYVRHDNTKVWALGDAWMDIRFYKDGDIIYTETAYIQVVKQITTKPTL